jgi:homoserine acetyltransferase
MPASPFDIELSKYWALLSPEQKKSLVEVIKSFVQSPERISIEQYNRELKEAEEEYQAGNYISSEEMLKLIRKW